ARRFRVTAGTYSAPSRLKLQPPRMISPSFLVRIDEQTGAIKNLFGTAVARELVNTNSATALNDYFYLPGSDVAGVQRNCKRRLSIKENGPLVASVLIESEAPGCRSLRREVRVFDGLDRMELINTVDRLPIRTKEGLHFGFGFSVPRGTVKMDVGW